MHSGPGRKEVPTNFAKTMPTAECLQSPWCSVYPQTSGRSGCTLWENIMQAMTFGHWLRCGNAVRSDGASSRRVMEFATRLQTVVSFARTLAQSGPRLSRVAFLAALVGPCALAQTIDAFDPLPQASPVTLAIQADGKILLGGYFLNNTLVGVQRLNADGSADASFVEPDVSADVKAVAVQA